MDKSRQQFEEFISRNRAMLGENPFRRDNDSGLYYYPNIRNAYFFWQASRESLINSLKPICFGIINEEDGKLFLDRAKNKKERAIYHRDILSKYSLGKKLTISPLYRLD